MFYFVDDYYTKNYEMITELNGHYTSIGTKFIVINAVLLDQKRNKKTLANGGLKSV